MEQAINLYQLPGTQSHGAALQFYHPAEISAK